MMIQAGRRVHAKHVHDGHRYRLSVLSQSDGPPLGPAQRFKLMGVVSC